MAVALSIVAATNIIMAISVNSNSLAIREMRAELLVASSNLLTTNNNNTNNVLTQIQQHKEISLANRAVQDESRILLQNFMRYDEDFHRKMLQRK